MSAHWLEDFITGALPPPERWATPGLVMFFNLACAACVSRGIPLMKRLHAEYGERAVFLLVHTAHGHRTYPREDVAPTLRRFVEDFARLSVPVALDLDGSVAMAWGVEGTPHWLVFAAGGDLLRSIFGSQENAVTRLEYLLAELVT